MIKPNIKPEINDEIFCSFDTFWRRAKFCMPSFVKFEVQKPSVKKFRIFFNSTSLLRKINVIKYFNSYLKCLGKCAENIYMQSKHTKMLKY